jgi:hypothetical protein
VTNESITRHNGSLVYNEDHEMKLSLGLTQLSVHVYLLRTFKEDLLLFFNNFSLRKPLATEEVRRKLLKSIFRL